jgi:hypothetical protein
MMIRTLFAAESTERGGWLRHLLFPGVMGVVVAIVMELFQLLNAQPKEAIDLLSHWGPNFVLGLLIVAIIGGLLSQVVDISRDGVAAQRQMAEAMGKIAEKDDRQLQEIQTLTTFAAQQAERTHSHLRDQRNQLDRIEQLLNSRAQGATGG